MLQSRKPVLLFTAVLLASTSAYAQIGAAQNHMSNAPKIVVQSGSEFKQEGGSTIEFKDGAPVQQTGRTVTVTEGQFKQEGSGLKVEGGSEFKQEGGSKVVVGPGGTLKIDQTGGDKRPQPAATAVKNTQGFSKSPADSSNATSKPNKNPEMSPGGLEASKAKCEAACKEKIKSLDKFKPDSGASDQVLASAGTQEQKDAIKAKKEAEAKNEADYQACLAKCPK